MEKLSTQPILIDEESYQWKEFHFAPIPLFDKFYFDSIDMFMNKVFA